MYTREQIRNFIYCEKYPDKRFEIPEDNPKNLTHGNWIENRYQLWAEDQVFILAISHKLTMEKFKACLILNNQPIARVGSHKQHKNHTGKHTRTPEHVHILCPDSFPVNSNLSFVLFTNKFQSNKSSFYNFVQNFFNIQEYQNHDPQQRLF